MENISNILVSAADFILDKKNLAKARLTQFEPGQIIKATVVKNLTAKQIQLSISGKNITAKTYVPLKPGDIVFLKSVKSGSQPVLKLIGLHPENQAPQTRPGFSPSIGRSGPFEPLLQLLETAEPKAENKNMPIKIKFQTEGIRQIKRLISKIALKSDTAEPAILNNLITTSGLTFEERLADLINAKPEILQKGLRELSQNDLKALALKLSAATGDKESTHFLKMFIEGLDNYQLLNHQAFKDMGRYLLPFPMIFDNIYKFGQLYLDVGKNSGKRSEADQNLVRVAVLLELSNIGDMLADFSILKKAINGTFRLTSEEARSLVEKNVPRLREKLNAHGFNVHQITCLRVEPTELAETTLADRMIDKDAGGLNLIV